MILPTHYSLEERVGSRFVKIATYKTNEQARSQLIMQKEHFPTASYRVVKTERTITIII